MPDPNVGEIAASTIDNYSGVFADNVTNHSPLLREIMTRGNITPATGGDKIKQELMYAENSTFKWYSGLELLDVTDSPVVDAAQFDWKQANVNVVIPGLTEIKNSGEAAIQNLVKAKIKVAEITAKNSVNTALFSNGTGTDGKEIGGLQLLVADDPSTGTVGNISRVSNSWWRNQTYDFSTESSGNANASATNIKEGMNVLWRRCIRNSDQPKVILMDDDYFGYYEASLQSLMQITTAKEADAGFEVLMYKGAKVYYDADCPDKHMYFLNTDYLFFRPHPKRNFTTMEGNGGKRFSVNQDAYVIPMFWAGNLTTSNASLQGVGKN